MIVGKAPAQRFTVSIDILTSRSGFFNAARKSGQTDPTKPTCLENEDPKLFSAYLKCISHGIEALNTGANPPEDDRPALEVEESELGPDVFLCPVEDLARYEAAYSAAMCEHDRYRNRCARDLVDLYLLADRLQDLQTANLVMDKLVLFNPEGNDEDDDVFGHEVIRHVYDSTVRGHPLRRLMRDECVYDQNSATYMQVHVEGGHPEFLRDVAVEFLRLRDADVLEGGLDLLLRESSERDSDKCHYHQHSETHPRCVLKEEK